MIENINRTFVDAAVDPHQDHSPEIHRLHPETF